MSLSSTLLAVVGIDDALALTIFSFAEPVALIKAKGSGHLSLITAVVHPRFTTAIIEVVGPLATKYAVSMAEEIRD